MTRLCPDSPLTTIGNNSSDSNNCNDSNRNNSNNSNSNNSNNSNSNDSNNSNKQSPADWPFQKQSPAGL